MRPKRILITGGAGFIGTHLSKRLLAEGHELTILDIANPNETALARLSLLAHPALSYVRGSVTGGRAWSRLALNFDHIVHAAAVLGVERVARAPIETMDATILGTRDCLDFAAKQISLQRFLFLSTSEIYGVSAEQVRETNAAKIPARGKRWCYAAAKLAGEFYVTSFAERHGFDFTIVRPFNVYGPERTSPNAVTAMTQRAHANEPIHVEGTGYQTRSWCFIDDFVEGLMKCLFFDAARNEIFNLGNDERQIGVLELAELIREIAKSSSRIVVTGLEQEDIQDRSPDLEKARRLIGYRPAVGIHDGLKRLIQRGASGTGIQATSEVRGGLPSVV